MLTNPLNYNYTSSFGSIQFSRKSLSTKVLGIIYFFAQQLSGADPGGTRWTAPLPTSKIEHLNFWWQPSFYPVFYFNFVIAYLYFLIFLISISFLNYNWKMAILIVYLSLICIYSIMLIFSHLSLITILNKI